jgi:hypothetical protein
MGYYNVSEIRGGMRAVLTGGQNNFPNMIANA